MHGGSQAVRLPKEFRVDGTEVEIWRDGDIIHLKPARRDLEEMFREIDRRRGNEVLELAPREPWPERDYGFDAEP